MAKDRLSDRQADLIDRANGRRDLYADCTRGRSVPGPGGGISVGHRRHQIDVLVRRGMLRKSPAGNVLATDVGRDALAEYHNARPLEATE